MKRWISLLLCMACLMSLISGAQAGTPKPISVIPYDELPDAIDGQYHYLLLCVDQWHSSPKNIGWTDGIVLVTLDTRMHRVMLTSFIRDALVLRDGRIGKINRVAKEHGGPEALCRVISEHIGVRVEKYILFDFSQIQSIIDYLGGVDITITDAEAEYLKRYAIPKDSTQPRLRSAGTYHFEGHPAVIYMRIRKVGGGGDFMRTQRVRTVLSTLADKCRTITYEDAKLLVNSVVDHSTMTNMNMDDMLTAMDQAFGLRDCTIEELRIPPDGAAHGITYAAMASQELDWEVCREAMADFLQNSFLVVNEQSDDEFDDLDGSFGLDD